MGHSQDDLAVVELAQPVTTRRPVALDSGTDSAETSVGAWVVEFGYGDYKGDTSLVPLPGSPPQQHLVDTIERAGQLFLGPRRDFAQTFGARLDPPGLVVAIDPGYDKANNVPSGRCMEGDSGGPWFSTPRVDP